MKSPAVDHGYRSARSAEFASECSQLPTVAIIVPVHNEIEHIDRLADEMLGQNYPGIREVWFVDGVSNDGTFAALQRIAWRDVRVRVISNAKRLPAAALNLALEKVTAEVVIRIDAHASYSDDVVSESVAALLATGAGGVGAIARPIVGQTLSARTIAAAHESRLGVGVARFRQADAEGWVDSVWNGCYWLHVVQEVGPFDEHLWRSEDNDFSERVRRAGYGIYLSPRIRAFYEPRQTFGALWKQYFGNGAGIMLALASNPRAVRLRHIVPLLFVLALTSLLAASFIWPPMLYVLLAVLGIYLLAIAAACVAELRRKRGAHVVLLPAALLVLHFSYGFGSLNGAARMARRWLRAVCTPAKRAFR